MGLIARTIRVIRVKLNKLLSSQEDPIEQLELKHQEMREERRAIKKSIINVKAKRKSIERKVESFEEDAQEKNSQARAAMRQGEEDVARRAIEQKKSNMSAAEDLRGQAQEIENIEDDMYDRFDEITNRIKQLQTQKDILKAKYEGAEAMKDVNEQMVDGLTNHSVEQNVKDIKNDIDDMHSRAEAVQEFKQQEAEEDIETTLEEIATNERVESEMESLREEFDVSSNEEVEIVHE